MVETIELIIRAVPKGSIFDSHYVIAELIQNHSDVYLNYAAETDPCPKKTEVVHSSISKVIASFVQRGLITNSGHKSLSHNIHGNDTDCDSWIKN